jgi:hypothetical protein
LTSFKRWTQAHALLKVSFDVVSVLVCLAMLLGVSYGLTNPDISDHKYSIMFVALSFVPLTVMSLIWLSLRRIVTFDLRGQGKIGSYGFRRYTPRQMIKRAVIVFGGATAFLTIVHLLKLIWTL